MTSAAWWSHLGGMGYFERECVAAVTCLARLRASLAAAAAASLQGAEAAGAIAGEQALMLQAATQVCVCYCCCCYGVCVWACR